MSVPLTPLDPWVARRLGSGIRLSGRAELEEAQQAALRRLLRQAMQASFYRERLAGLEDAPLAELPFTFPSDLAGSETRFLTVSQSRIRRVVTLSTSGTTAAPKRLCFTDEDLDSTEDFFLHGMSTFTPPGSVAAVFMEGPRPDSIGQLLVRALARIGCATHVFGLVRDPAEAAARVDAVRPDVVVGLPAQLGSVAGRTRHRPESVLVSADMSPPSLRKRIEERWSCTVYNHYGLTESGWGAAVECRARQGCHVRELDLLLEIVDAKGRVLPDGQWGEVVLTTLGRAAFPLVRYRTGDEGRFLPGTCPCGSLLKRLEVIGRLPRKGAGGLPLRLYDVEDALWGFPWIEDFRVSLAGPAESPETMTVVISVSGDPGPLAGEAVAEVLRKVPGAPGDVVVKWQVLSLLDRSRPKRDWWE